MIRRQLPASTPLSLGRLVRSGLSGSMSADRARAGLEAHLRTRFFADRAVLTGSGTQALQLALAMPSGRKRGEGSLVALPAYSCYDLISAAVGAGASVVFYDVDPVSLAPDTDSLVRALERGAHRVVAANLFGFPLDWAELRRTCNEAGTLLIEDFAQGIGSGWGQLPGGAFGDATVLSFGRGKGWTGGAGGALLLRLGRSEQVAEPVWTPELARPALGVASWAKAVTQWALGRPALYGLPNMVPGLNLGDTRYHEPRPPRAMPGPVAGAVLAHAELAANAAAARRDLAETWSAMWERVDGPTVVDRCQPLTGGTSGYLRFPVLARSAQHASDLQRNGAHLGLARGYPVPLHDLAKGRCPVVDSQSGLEGAARLAGSLITLPTHGDVKDRDLEALRALLGLSDSMRVTRARSGR